MITRLLQRVASWEGFLAAMFAVVLLYAVVSVPHFATAFNLSQAAAGVSEKALLLLPMVFLIIAREIDLSVASILALTSVVLGLLIRAGVPLPSAIPIVLLAGTAAGAVNGFLVTRLNLPSLVVTLGTMALFRGIGYIMLGTRSVNELPDALTDFGINTVGSTLIPWTLVPFLVLAPLFAFALQRTALGRRIYTVGANPEAALYSGISVQRLRFWLFVTSGLVCALAGIVFTARLSNARADNAVGFELDVITIVLLGGISVFGGRGKLTGVLWALALVATIRNILGLLQIGGDGQGVAIGFLLILSLLLNNSLRNLLERARTRRLFRIIASRRPQTAADADAANADPGITY
ncbi:MAG: ABC transporter permease [Verrucomicrobia bacterium]|nr:ABC transporter permease [Verrucomicrobiota bacterium]